MADLATTEDLEARLGRSLTAEEAARAPSLLADASGAVRVRARQPLVETTSTARLRVRGTKVRLPRRPATAVDAVADVDGNALDFTWYAGQVVTLTGYPLGGWVDVTYTHGYPAGDERLAPIVGVVCAMVLRALGVKPTDAGIVQESVGNYSYTVGSAAAAGAVGMLEAEAAIVDAFAGPKIGTVVLG